MSKNKISEEQRRREIRGNTSKGEKKKKNRWKVN